MFELHELGLSDAHPMLVRTGASHLNGFFNDGMVNGFQTRLFFRIHGVPHEHHMQIAVSCMSENIADGAVFIHDLLRKHDELGIAGDRNRCINDQSLFFRMGAMDGLPRLVAGAPQVFAGTFRGFQM